MGGWVGGKVILTTADHSQNKKKIHKRQVWTNDQYKSSWEHDRKIKSALKFNSN